MLIRWLCDFIALINSCVVFLIVAESVGLAKEDAGLLESPSTILIEINIKKIRNLARKRFNSLTVQPVEAAK